MPLNSITDIITDLANGTLGHSSKPFILQAAKMFIYTILPLQLTDSETVTVAMGVQIP